MPRAAGAALAAALLAATAACIHGEPPAPDASPSIALPEMAPTVLPPVPATPSSVGTAPAPSSSTAAAAPANEVDPALLPQTRDRPVASGAPFDARVAALWAGIVDDDPEKAMAFFFPLAAYRQVKDVADPAADWKRRLVAAYARDVHALHAQLHHDGDRAALVGLEVPDARARWVDPGEEYNKLGYFRVFGSNLRYAVDGEARSLAVTSLISWRGDWYVVHLGAIQ